ncbi:MAG: response regulator [Halobacteriales archaeon]|nr:response regulator [Halobacteriales archaeon]
MSLEQDARSRRRHPVILVVDDEPDLLDSYAVLLTEDVGARVLTALSGAEALEVLRRNHVDLILSDYRMPGMNGLDFLQAAKAIAGKTPMVMVTAYSDAQVEDRARRVVGVRKFLSKVLTPEELVRQVRDVLG